MTKTLVEELRTSTDPEWFRALMITAASRIEELERALKYYAMPQIYAERKSLAPAIMFERGEIARQALSEPSPDAPAKRIGAARYLEG